MKKLIAIIAIISLSFFVAAKDKKPHGKPQLAPVTGITIHLPSDGAFQFYVMKQCGGTLDNPDAYVEWDHELWPAGCYPSLWARAAYGWIEMSPIYNPNWVEWIPANDLIVRDFIFVAPAGFWTAPTYNYASVFDLCGNYLGEFLPQLEATGYPAAGEYWIDFDSFGNVRVGTSKPFDWDWYLQNGTTNPAPRTEGVIFVEDASGLPNLCP